MFQYDAENKLTYYQSPTGSSSSYVYNGMGLRVTENDSGSSGEHDYLHDGAAPASGLLIDSNLTGSQLFHVYTPGIDQSDAGTGAVHLMAVDALGTVRGFVNNNAGAAVTDTFGPLAFGAQRTRTGSDAFSLAWGGADGYQTDANGLVLLGNRVYHPYTGRFLTRDPAGAGSNDYEYADNDPLGEIDPLGLNPDGALAAAEGVGASPGDTVTETDSTTDPSGKTTSTQIQYLVIDNPFGSGLSVIPIPPGADLFANISQAQSFCNMVDHAPSAPFSLFSDLKPTTRQSDVMEKAGAKLGWAMGKMGPLMPWDYKTKGAKYEPFGAFNAGAVAAAMGYDKSTYLNGAEAIHNAVHPLLPNEPETMTAAGYDFFMKYMAH